MGHAIDLGGFVLEILRDVLTHPSGERCQVFADGIDGFPPGEDVVDFRRFAGQSVQFGQHAFELLVGLAPVLITADVRI